MKLHPNYVKFNQSLLYTLFNSPLFMRLSHLSCTDAG